MAFQNRITAVEDPSRGGDSAEMAVRLHDARTIISRIDHCLGSSSNPMTDVQLDAKFTALSDAVIGAERSRKLIAACRDLENLVDASAIARDAM